MLPAEPRNIHGRFGDSDNFGSHLDHLPAFADLIQTPIPSYPPNEPLPLFGTVPVYDGDQIIEERDQTGALLATYTYGPGIDELLTMNRSGQTYYYFHDGLGSVADLTLLSGELIAKNSYPQLGLRAIPTSILALSHLG